jgi:hypothetical protein
MRIYSILEPKVYKTVSLWLLPSISVHTEKYWGVKKGFTIALVFLRYCAQVTIWRARL